MGVLGSDRIRPRYSISFRLSPERGALCEEGLAGPRNPEPSPLSPGPEPKGGSPVLVRPPHSGVSARSGPTSPLLHRDLEARPLSVYTFGCSWRKRLKNSIASMNV